MSSNHAGFAPVKLLLVVVAVGAVAAVAIPKGTSSADTTRLRAVRSDVLKAELAEEAYYSDHARYATLSQLLASGFVLSDGTTMKITTTPLGYTIRATNPDIDSKLQGCAVRVGGQPISMDGEIRCP
ncbi:MAG: hypothetical protein ABUL71_02010 [Gemmatimonadota bacterium]